MRSSVFGRSRWIGGVRKSAVKCNVVLRAALCCSLVSGLGSNAHAQIPLERIARQHPRFAERILSPQLNAGKPARFIVPRVNARGSASSVRLTDQYVMVTARDRDSYRGISWSPPKRLLMDEVHDWVDTGGFVRALQEQMPGLEGAGKGVTIGIVDGGIDLRHPDLRNADGSTRADWLLDFASGPLGYHVELEEEYGCTDPETPCAILASSEIDQVLTGATTSIALPRDRLGHGTHVASIAAGGGQANPAYAGIAPQASLVVALLAVDSVEVQDADVLLASRFVYDRADEAGQPAVVNLSLGGDFGPHDGSTMLERALVSLVDRPGRAMVVAAGNSGTTFADGPTALVGPFGIHTDVRIAGEGHVALAIPSEQSTFEGDVLIWVDTKPGESLAVGVESATATIVAPVAVGDSADGTTDEWDVLVTNQASLDEESLADLEGGALVLLSGKFARNEVIRLRLVGDAHAALWVQGSGDLSVTAGTRGPLFAMARQGGTITVPATAPELIAVGATLNRTTWQSRDSGETELALFTEALDDTPGSVGFFSSVGPNQIGNAKPDILAPGAVVIAAMAPSADPLPPGGTGNSVSMFGESAMCETDALCTVVDNNYGVAIGTSMASPVVAGAVALLLERDPSLSQAELMHLLRAGASRQMASKTTPDWEKALPAAPGFLNLPRTLQALQLQTATAGTVTAPDNGESWLTFADSYVSPGQSVEVHFWARTTENTPALIDATALDVSVKNGKVSRKLTRIGPGLFQLIVKANADAPIGGGSALDVRVRFDGATLAEAELPIAGDLSDVRGFARGAPTLRDESCDLGERHGSRPSGLSLFVLTSLALLRRRHHRRGDGAAAGRP